MPRGYEPRTGCGGPLPGYRCSTRRNLPSPAIPDRPWPIPSQARVRGSSAAPTTEVIASYSPGLRSLKSNLHLPPPPFPGRLHILAHVDIDLLFPAPVHLVLHHPGTGQAFDLQLRVMTQPHGNQIPRHRNGLHSRFEAVSPGSQGMIRSRPLAVQGIVGRGSDRHGHRVRCGLGRLALIRLAPRHQPGQCHQHQGKSGGIHSPLRANC